jgi:WD40 repeat protein/DNA-binding SARP family transcriptional activator
VYRRAVRYQVLGPLEVHVGNGPVPLGGPKQRAVLLHLLLRANHTVAAPTLIEELWGDDPPDSARNTLQTYVSHLRKALGPERIEGRPPGYRLEVGPDELDADRFHTLLRDARKAGATDPSAAVPILEQALALWRGPAFADLADEPSLTGEAARLNELRLVAEEERLEALLAAGEHARVAGDAEALLGHHHLRERVWGQLMLALYRSGRQADALAAFQRARDLLAEELGIDPSPELTALHERILRQDPDLELRGEPLRGYRLLERLGDGPRAAVYRAIQPKVGRDVAITIIHAAIASDPGYIRRFETDAQAVAALEHPHVVPVHDYWREPEGAYVVTRYLRGGSLASRLAAGRAPAPDRARRIAEQVTSALAFAHRQGVVHGDVSEANVLFDLDDNAYLGDFRIGTPAALEPADDIAALAGLIRTLVAGAATPALLDVLDRIEAGDALVTLEEMERALIGSGTTTPASAAGGAAVRNPYKGLRAFTHADARDFFGREALTETLVRMLGEPGPDGRFVAVIGPSGSGKSSLVRAGVLPRLAAGALPGSADWFAAEMLPGAHPIEELEAALIRIAASPVSRLLERLESGSRGLIQTVDLIVPGDTEVLLVVDQFEELFTLTDDERERSTFLELLRVAAADPGSRLRVVLTLRADFYDRPLEEPRFSELLAARSVAVPPLTSDELERAITAPAREVGARVEPGLVAEIVGDVASQPGALPLVEFALTELFERRDDQGAMSLGSYRQIGGVAGALAARAEHLFGAMGPGGQAAARQVLLRLVTLGEGREDTRRRVTRAELAALDLDVENLDAMLDAFGRHRLLTFDREPSTREPTVEIAHEALLREWPRLRGWIDEARDDLRRARALTRSATEWHAADDDPSFLLVGSRLDQTESWTATTGLALGRIEREYVAASSTQRDRERDAAAQREVHEQQLEARSRTRLRALVAVLAVAALVATTLTVVALGQRGTALEQGRLASARELAAAAMTSMDIDPKRSIELAMQAIDATADDDVILREAVDALHAAIAADRLLFTIDDPSTGNAVWSPSGDLIATGGSVGGNAVTDPVLWDAETGEEVRRFTGHEGDVESIAFSNDGSMLVTTAADRTTRIWEVDTGTQLASIPIAEYEYVLGGAFSPDGRRLIIGTGCCADGRLRPTAMRVIDTRSWREVDTIPREPQRGEFWASPSYSPDGTRIVAENAIWDARTGGRLVEMPGDHGIWRSDGAVIAQVVSGGLVSSIHMVDATDGTIVDRVPVPGGVTGNSWSPDGTLFATGGYDGIARVFDTQTGEEILTLAGHQGLVGLVSFSSDGTRLVTGGADGAARVWDVSPEGGAELQAAAYAGWMNEVTFSPDGSTIATAGWDGGWSWDGSTLVRVDPMPEAEQGVAYSPDGSAMATSGGGGTTMIDVATGEVRATLPPASKVAFSPDGSLLASAGDGPTVHLFDVADGDEVGGELSDPEAPLESSEAIAFSPDGSSVAVMDGRATARV